MKQSFFQAITCPGKMGFGYFFSDKIALEPSVIYRLGLSDEDKGAQFNGFGAQLGISVFF